MRRTGDPGRIDRMDLPGISWIPRWDGLSLRSIPTPKTLLQLFLGIPAKWFLMIHHEITDISVQIILSQRVTKYRPGESGYVCATWIRNQRGYAPASHRARPVYGALFIVEVANLPVDKRMLLIARRPDWSAQGFISREVSHPGLNGRCLYIIISEPSLIVLSRRRWCVTFSSCKKKKYERVFTQYFI